MTEEWRPAPGWEAAYSVSSLGRVRRNTGRSAGRILTGSWGSGYGRTRYLNVRISMNAKGATVRIANLVAAAFIGPRAPGMEVNHKDGDKANNAATNLEYVSRRQNEDHAAANALHAWGEAHGMAKLTADQVRAIRAQPFENDREWAEVVGVRPSTIRDARMGRTWHHLDRFPVREREQVVTRSQAEKRKNQHLAAEDK